MERTDKLLLDVSEAAALLGISRPTMYQVMNRDDFRADIRIGTRRKISRRGLEEWISNQVNGGVENAK